MEKDPVVIVGLARTPMGAFQGELKSFAAPELGAAAIRAAVERAKIRPEEVQEVIMGCVLPAGQGQAPARQASLGAGLPLDTGCTTINKMCGSGMKAAMFAHDVLLTEKNHILVAGGMESMTNAPYLLPKARAGLRMGHGQVIDHMFYDGLEDAYDKGRLMGTFAEECAQKYLFRREEQAAFQGEPRENPNPETGLQKGRHRDRGELQFDIGRRGRPRHDAPLDGGEARPCAHRRGGRALDACAGARLVHDRAGGRHPKIAGKDPVEDERRRPLRNQ
jgi:hypothetical protein